MLSLPLAPAADNALKAETKCWGQVEERRGERQQYGIQHHKSAGEELGLPRFLFAGLPSWTL